MIYEIRGQKVMIDRFPSDFMFQLTDIEWKNLRSQIVTFSSDTRKYKPYAFTEHGILMLSSVLNSDKAVKINIQVMRIFVQMRHYAFSHNAAIVIALNNLIEQPPKTKRIGFNAE
jgi:hypothetical protein